LRLLLYLEVHEDYIRHGGQRQEGSQETPQVEIATSWRSSADRCTSSAAYSTSSAAYSTSSAAYSTSSAAYSTSTAASCTAASCTTRNLEGACKLRSHVPSRLRVSRASSVVSAPKSRASIPHVQATNPPNNPPQGGADVRCCGDCLRLIRQCAAPPRAQSRAHLAANKNLICGRTLKDPRVRHSQGCQRSSTEGFPGLKDPGKTTMSG
jgi:hypothetical protein